MSPLHCFIIVSNLKCFYDDALMEIGSRTEHYLFHVLGIAPKCRSKVCVQWMSRYFDTDRSKAGYFDLTLALCKQVQEKVFHVVFRILL